MPLNQDDLRPIWLLEQVVQIAEHMVPGNRIGMVGVEHVRAGGLRKEGGSEGSVVVHIPIRCQDEDSALVQALERRSQCASQCAFPRSGAASDPNYNVRWHTKYSYPIATPSCGAVVNSRSMVRRIT